MLHIGTVKMKKIIKDKIFDEERALYGLVNTDVVGCTFAGEADGESALKECSHINVNNCVFSLRYPLWHAKGHRVENSNFDDKARAPLWYSVDGEFKGCNIKCVKFLRECTNIAFSDCEIVSLEFGWKCKDISLKDTYVEGEYLFLDSKNVSLENVKMKGKYSFQYIDGLTIKNSYLDTKDAFWHSKNIRVENSTVKGEYLGWFSEGLTLVNCKIIGTQPLCYCKDLTLIDCTMEGCDLSFEYSDVNATVNGHIDSVKNIRSGKVVADSVGEIINGDAVMECTGELIIR